jgi:membrane-bound lytic murein transglycosylase B
MYSFRNLLVIGIVIFFLLITFSYSKAATKLKAADLVKNGQLINLTQDKYKKLFKELREKYQFKQAELDTLFQGVKIDKKILELHDQQWEAKPYYKYWPLFITSSVVSKGKARLEENKAILDRVEKKFGVNREFILAIWGVETQYGSNTGNYSVFKTLNTLFDAYPRRSKFFRKELIHFLLLCRENNMDPKDIKGSYAGAFGQAQFMPSSFREYAVSFDGNKDRDHFNSREDILASIANYLHRFNWAFNSPLYVDIGNDLKSPALISANLKGRKNGLINHVNVSEAQGIQLPPPPTNQKVAIVGLEIDPEKGGGFRYIAAYPNFSVITKYNNSNKYAMAVTELAEAIRE